LIELSVAIFFTLSEAEGSQSFRLHCHWQQKSKVGAVFIDCVIIPASNNSYCIRDISRLGAGRRRPKVGTETGEAVSETKFRWQSGGRVQ
jgi:hypothetical protein